MMDKSNKLMLGSQIIYYLYAKLSHILYEYYPF